MHMKTDEFSGDVVLNIALTIVFIKEELRNTNVTTPVTFGPSVECSRSKIY